MTDTHKKSSAVDRERLRTLAARYAEIANNDEMARRRERWRLTNGLKKRTIPFQIEDNGTFFKDLMPDLQCMGTTERNYERQMLRAVVNYELINDNRVFAPFFDVGWTVSRPDICPEFESTHAQDGFGGSLGYTTNKPLADLPNSLNKLQRGEFGVDRDGTLQRAEMAHSLFGDILPVRITEHGSIWAGAGMAGDAVNWIGMENLYLLMIDQPDSVHAFFDFVATERCDYLDWLEKEGLLRLNNGEVCVGSGSCGYTDELPRRDIGPEAPARYDDLWGFQESQEATGISPDMYAEFIFPYQYRVSSRFGLLYFGCCEPVHNLYPVIKRFENLRKITVSPWCDQEVIAAAVGKKVVLSRKPHPMKLCGETFNPEDFRAHIQETLTISRDSFVELIFRDTCTLRGDMKDRLAEACRIVRELVADAGKVA